VSNINQCFLHIVLSRSSGLGNPFRLNRMKMVVRSRKRFFWAFSPLLLSAPCAAFDVPLLCLTAPKPA